MAAMIGVANAHGNARLQPIHDFPQQDNEVDCGVYVILAMGAVMFSNVNVPYIDWDKKVTSKMAYQTR